MTTPKPSHLSFLFSFFAADHPLSFRMLREEAAQREDTIANVSFVNGITRTQYDDMALQDIPTFDNLNNVDQNPWNYVFFCESAGYQSNNSITCLLPLSGNFLSHLLCCLPVCNTAGTNHLRLLSGEEEPARLHGR